MATLSVVIALFLGPILYGLLPFDIPFQTNKLDIIWSVHATVISLSLVGLSFAWSSIRDLPTTRDIVDEITFRLRSLETISYLLASNLCIGLVILVSDGEFVSPGLGWSVGFLLVGSFSIVVIRFMRVLDLLLHNSLDDMVSTFAEDSLNGKSGREDQEYIIYVEHFLSAAQRSIENDRPEDLREDLRQIEHLMSSLLFSEGRGSQETWKETLRNYEMVHRWAVREQNPILEKKVISSLHGLDLTISNYDYHDLSNRTISHFAKFLEQGFEYREDPAVEHLLSRFKTAHIRVLGKFESADSLESLNVAESHVENLLETHTRLWRTSVENESRKAIDYIEYLFDDIDQFQQYKYRKTAFIGPSQPHLYHKRNNAESYQKEVSLLKFASYGWGLRLYKEGDLSEDFLAVLFSKLNDNFQSSRDLSEKYVQALNENQLLRYWERWNLERELEDSHGPVMTGMSVNTWLLEFYCVAIVSYFDRKNSRSLCNPEDSPFVENEINNHQIDEIIEVLKSYRSDYPADFLIDEYPPIESRCDAIIEYFTSVKEVVIREEIENIRQQEISDAKVGRYQKHVDEQLGNRELRLAIEHTSGISNGDIDFDSFSHTIYKRRNGFVDPDRPTQFTSTLPDLFEKYYEFVLERVELEHQEVELKELPDTLEAASADVFVVGDRDIIEMLRQDDRSEHPRSPGINELLRFNEIPVLEAHLGSFDVIGLFDNELDYMEPDDEYPIDVEVTAGEELDDFDADSNPEDFVQVDFTYRGKIEGGSRDGIMFDLEDDD